MVGFVFSHSLGDLDDAVRHQRRRFIEAFFCTPGKDPWQHQQGSQSRSGQSGLLRPRPSGADFLCSPAFAHAGSHRYHARYHVNWSLRWGVTGCLNLLSPLCSASRYSSRNFSALVSIRIAFATRYTRTHDHAHIGLQVKGRTGEQ